MACSPAKRQAMEICPNLHPRKIWVNIRTQRSSTLIFVRILSQFTRKNVCYNVEHKEFHILCEYVCQRGQQGVKRCEWVSGLDFGPKSSYAFCSGQSVYCWIF